MYASHIYTRIKSAVGIDHRIKLSLLYIESDIIFEGLSLMHKLRYLYKDDWQQMIGNGDSSIYYSVTISVHYGADSF